MRIDRATILSAVLLGAILAGGCRRVDDVVWSKYAALPPEGWDPVNVIPFFPWPEDSITSPTDRYSLLLSVRFTPLRLPAPLHLVVKQEDDAGYEKADTFRIELKTPALTPTGRGAYGIYESVDTLATGIELRPGYCVELQSLSVPDNTAGITDIGLILSLENGNRSFFKRLHNLPI